MSGSGRRGVGLGAGFGQEAGGVFQVFVRAGGVQGVYQLAPGQVGLLQLEAVQPAAAAGLGAAILPSSCDHIRVEGSRFVALADAGAHSEVQLAWHRERVTPLIRNFAGLLRVARGEVAR